MSTSPRARTSDEMRFFVSLQPCPHCGVRVDSEPLKLYGSGTAWALSGKCTSCGGPVGFPFLTIGDPLTTERKYDRLGLGHSELISPGTFVAEIDRLAPTVVTDVTRLGVPDWKRNRDTNMRVTICLNELAKFLPAVGDSIPDGLLTPVDRADRDARPDRYSRRWIEEMAAHHQRVIAANIADLPRIDRLEEGQEKKRPKGVDWLEREHMQAHEAWVERGKKGKGKLVLVGATHEDMKVGRGVELSGAVFFDVSMPNVGLEDAKMIGVELTDASFDGGRFYGALLQGAKVRGGSFKRALLETAELQGISIDGTDFTEAELHFSEWKDARVANATFERATFGDANLDGARFRSCNFRNADMNADDPDRPPTTKAIFEDCDFRDSTWEARDLSGAKFIRCKLAGMSGKAASVVGVEIVGADISASEALHRWTDG